MIAPNPAGNEEPTRTIEITESAHRKLMEMVRNGEPEEANISDWIEAEYDGYCEMYGEPDNAF